MLPDAYRRTVFRVFVDVVRIDGDHGEPARLVLAREPGKLRSDVTDERTMTADERHEQRVRVTNVIRRNETAVEVSELK